MTLGILRLVASIVLALAVTAAAAAAPRNIFDDDWAPPKSDNPPAKPPAPPVKVDSPKKVDPPTKVAPPATIPDVAAPAPRHEPIAPVARRPVPTKAEQAPVRKLLKEVFAEQLASPSVPARRKLTEAVVAQADKSADAPVEQFVLLAAGIDAATEGASLPMAFKAADRMAGAFDVDALAIKSDVATRLVPRPGAGEFADENVRAALALVDQLADAGNSVAAERVCAAMLPIAASSPALRGEVQKRQRDLFAAREAADKLARHLETLKTSPADPEANAEVGRFLCFRKADWRAGLPALARGNDPSLKAVATQELAGPGTPDAQLAVADAWWELSQAPAIAPTKDAIMAHAGEWYAKAAPNLKGLNKLKSEKRLASAGIAVPKAAPAGPVAAIPKPPPAAIAGSVKPAVAPEPAPAAGAAVVEVNADWEPLEENVGLMGNKQYLTAGKLPEVLRGHAYSHLKENTPRLTFKVVKDGVVWLACSSRFGGGGNSGGNWRPECTSRADLETIGWREVGAFPIEGQKLNIIVFSRDCKAGETFTYRTEKYISPFLVR